VYPPVGIGVRPINPVLRRVSVKLWTIHQHNRWEVLGVERLDVEKSCGKLSVVVSILNRS